MLKTIPSLRRALAPLIAVALAFAGSAAFSQDGVGKSSIVIGQSVALTGPAASLARRSPRAPGFSLTGSTQGAA